MRTTEEFFQLLIGDVGFFFVDYRGFRTWHREEESTPGSNQVGRRQLEAIKKTFREDGLFKNVRLAVFVSSLPVILLGERMNSLVLKISNDAQEQWTNVNGDE